MKALFEEFYKHYKHPEIEELTVGFSGVDPPEKTSTADHEELDNLLGGDAMGHYHLTKEQLEKVIAMFSETYPPIITPSQLITITAEAPMTPYGITGANITVS